MISLRWGLAALGALVLLMLLGYYLWLTRRGRPREVPGALAGNADHTSHEPTLDAPLPEAGVPDFVLPQPEKKPGLDALIDTLAPIALEAAISGDAVLAALPPTRRVGSKPFAVEGLNVSSQIWELPRAGQRYSALQAGVQLANRSGALNDIEFSEFVVQTQQFCDAVGATPDLPDMRAEVTRARELDQFASDHDAQIGFVLRARRAAWSTSYVQQMAVRQGFVPAAMAGRMALPARAAGSPGVVSLSFDALGDDASQSTALRDIHLALDVPQVDRQEAAFARMCTVAQALAQDMDGVVTDDNGVALPAQALTVIDSELDQLYNILEQHEFAAGSTLARRLFS
ncbi:MAG: cell division protein FtsZ [Comamonadaceae bacterium CG1_02_60_18]|nr:MAG: cell division protein FtsZ [Comamonadaceae bacterium CG1_02_60_18]PIQ51887.1 MAG: cell division protein FtsZ [Comamonadaceae bacterium CG12_big_fil_rev_8_21_14_0_65_59_15]